jgi:hypothetical protein
MAVDLSNCCRCAERQILMSTDHSPRLRALAEALHKVGVWSMVAQSDPHCSAAHYRAVLTEICNYVLKVQDADALLRAPELCGDVLYGSTCFREKGHDGGHHYQDEPASALSPEPPAHGNVVTDKPGWPVAAVCVLHGCQHEHDAAFIEQELEIRAEQAVAEVPALSPRDDEHKSVDGRA